MVLALEKEEWGIYRNHLYYFCKFSLSLKLVQTEMLKKKKRVHVKVLAQCLVQGWHSRNGGDGCGGSFRVWLFLQEKETAPLPSRGAFLIIPLPGPREVL